MLKKKKLNMNNKSIHETNYKKLYYQCITDIPFFRYT